MIKEFGQWCCSEPRLSLSKTVVLRCRIHLESCRLECLESADVAKSDDCERIGASAGITADTEVPPNYVDSPRWF